MGGPDGTVEWYAPDPRGIIDLSHFHIPNRLKRTIRQKQFIIKCNQNFAKVIRGCSARSETWINEEIISAYTMLHQLGKCHSVEAYLEDQLVGGLYGVALGGAFMGESMFSLENDSSKVCLVFLVSRLIERGFQLLDTQFITPHLKKFGAIEISRKDYMHRLEEALSLHRQFDSIVEKRTEQD